MSNKRRGHGEGSIYQQADGRWCAILNLGYSESGKRRRRYVRGKTKREVREKLLKLQQQRADGILLDSSKLTIGEFLERWLDDDVRLNVKPATLQSYAGIVRNHLKPRVGGVRLVRLTPAGVQRLYSELEKEGKSPRLRLYVHAVLRRSLSRAVRWGLVVRNVCEAVDPPRLIRKEMMVLNPDQAMMLIKAAEADRLHALYLVAITTGLRQGELYGLHWSDLNLEGATLSVRRTLVEINGKLTTAEPKTTKSRRLVALPAVAVEALFEHRKRAIAEGNAASQWVFCDENGGPLRRQNVQRRSFKPLLKSAGLPEIRFHDLRHTSATLLLSQGVHPKVVQERLGHAQISITLDTYSHVLPGMQEDAASRLDNLFNDKTG